MLGDAVWVEAEKDKRRGDVVLSLKSVVARRALKERYGRHTVRTSFNRLPNFPSNKIPDLQKGWPVQFQMDSGTYLNLLGVGAGGMGDLDLGRWKDYHSGDRVRISAPSSFHGGKIVTVEGIVYTADNYGTPDDPNWDIRFNRFESEWAPAGAGRWIQKTDGGTIEVLEHTQDLSVPPPASGQMRLPGVAGLGKKGRG